MILGLLLWACSPPSEPAQAAPSPASLRFHPDEEGFVRFWLASPPQPIDALPLSPVPPDSTWTPEIASGPVLDLGTETKVGRWVTVDLVSNRARRVELTLGSDDGSSVWIAGKEILTAPGAHAYQTANKRSWLDLPAGTTPLSVRVEQGDGAWRLGVQLLSDIGIGAEDIELRLPGIKNNSPAIITELVEAATLKSTVTLLETGYRFDLGLAPFAGVEGNPGISAESSGIPLGEPLTLTPAPGQPATARVQVVGGSENPRMIEFSRPFYPEIARRVIAAETFLAQQRSVHPDHFSTGKSRIQVGYATLEWLAARSRLLLELGDKDPSYLGALGKQMDWLMTGLSASRDPFEGKTGAFWLAYRSELDGQVQPFAVAVPSGFRRGQKWPMVVGLHGYKSEPGRFLREMVGVPLAKGQSDFSAERDFLTIPLLDPTMILVAPLGRGDVAFRGPGEVDVLEVIDVMKLGWEVDADQVHLTGVSMGGIGVFEMAVHRPDLFASATSLCGAADVRKYGSIAGKPVASFEVPVLSAIAAVEWAENLTNLPFTCIHGTRDRVNGIQNSAVMMDRLAKLGIAAVFEKPDLGHDVQSDAWGGGKLWQVSRPPRVKYPSHTVFVTRDLWYSGAYGVEIAQVFDRTALSRVVLDREPGRYRLQTENVAAATIEVQPGVRELIYQDQVIALPGKQASFVIDPQTEKLTLQDLPPFYRPQGPLGMMRPGPRLVVVPTQDPLSQKLAEQLARTWATPNGVKYTPAQVVLDRDFTWELARNKDLILIGNPTNNKVWGELTWELPFEVSAGGIRVPSHGDAWYKGADVGLVAITSRPDDPHHALIVVGALGPWGLSLARSLPRYLPDYLIFDQRIAGDAGSILGGRETLGGGFFPG